MQYFQAWPLCFRYSHKAEVQVVGAAWQDYTHHKLHHVREAEQLWGEGGTHAGRRQLSHRKRRVRYSQFQIGAEVDLAESLPFRIHPRSLHFAHLTRLDLSEH